MADQDLGAWTTGRRDSAVLVAAAAAAAAVAATGPMLSIPWLKGLGLSASIVMCKFQTVLGFFGI